MHAHKPLAALLLLLAGLALMGCGEDDPKRQALNYTSGSTIAANCAQVGAGSDVFTGPTGSYLDGDGGPIAGTTSCTPDITAELLTAPPKTNMWLIHYDTVGGFQDGGYFVQVDTNGTGFFSGSQVRARVFESSFAADVYCDWPTGAVNITQNAAAIGDIVSASITFTGTPNSVNGGTCYSGFTGTFYAIRTF